MAGRFDIRKLGNALGFMNEESKLGRNKVLVSLMGHLQAIVNTRAYGLTLGNLLKHMEEIDLKRLRRGDKKISREKLEGRLEVLEEISNYINSTIKNGQDAQTKLEEVENARRRTA